MRLSALLEPVGEARAIREALLVVMLLVDRMRDIPSNAPGSTVHQRWTHRAIPPRPLPVSATGGYDHPFTMDLNRPILGVEEPS